MYILILIYSEIINKKYFVKSNSFILRMYVGKLLRLQKRFVREKVKKEKILFKQRKIKV